MNIYDDSGQKISLTQNEYVTKGGEGKIYRVGDTIFKIYEDVVKMSKMVPKAKIKELQILDDPRISKPKSIIYNEKKEYIGFTMDAINNSVPLIKLFTNTYRDNCHIENDIIIELTENIKNINQFVHSKKCLIVDGNELNYLVKQNNYKVPYLIDLNSIQTPNYPATAIMRSIRDWTTDKFTEMTDWFSFAIITFQLFIGIHPFRGNHPNYPKNDFENRIRDKVSVLNSKVTIPDAARDFSLIPTSYMDWYFNLFEKGKRIPPPAGPGDLVTVQIKVKLIQSTNSFEIKSLFEIKEKILYHNPAIEVTRTKDKIYLGKLDYKVSSGVEVLFTPIENIPVFVKINNGIVEFKTIKDGITIQETQIAGNEMMIVDNHLFIKNEKNLLEFDFKVISNKIFPTIKVTWTIERLSSILYSNVIYQNVLGKAFLCIPQPNISGRSAFYVKAIPELNDYKVIEAKYQNKICMLIVYNNNEYHRATLIFDDTFANYSFKIISGIDYSSLNFIVLDNGLCIIITEDNAVEMFMNKIDKASIKRIEDPSVSNDMRLCKDGNIVKFYKDNKVYSLKMK